MRAYKFRLYPSKAQDQELQKHLWISKELWNMLLEKTIKKYDEEKKFPTRIELQKLVKNAGLHSQVAQAVAHRLYRALEAKIRAKQEGKPWGFPRFKNFDRMRSLYYPQSGFSLGKKLKITPFGEINIKKHRELQGKIKTLTLKREPTGKWFAVFCVEEEAAPGPQAEKPESPINPGPAIGIDLGLMNFAALSNGVLIKNPHHLKTWEEKLAKRQRKLSRKQRRSKNRRKAKIKVARVHEKISNVRKDFLHKTANTLLSQYSLLALEDLASQEMAGHGHGKGINDAGWNMFTNILAYKAESAGCRLVLVNPKNTSKECSGCGVLVEKSLHERRHNCPSCGLSIDRDTNAAINILQRATPGIGGSNACRDGRTIPSWKQEAHPFRGG